MGYKEDKAFNLLVTKAAKELAKATHLAGNITSEASWIEFDRTCHAAESHLADALALDMIIPSELEKELDDHIWEVTALRIRALEDRQMAKREQEAVRNPAGRYGIMKRRREIVEDALAADGNGHKGRLN